MKGEILRRRRQILPGPQLALRVCPRLHPQGFSDKFCGERASADLAFVTPVGAGEVSPERSGLLRGLREINVLGAWDSHGWRFTKKYNFKYTIAIENNREDSVDFGLLSQDGSPCSVLGKSAPTT